MTWRNPPVFGILKGSVSLAMVVEDRIFQTVAAETAGKPYLVWSITTAIPANLLGETPREDDQRVTVSVYARDQGAARLGIQAAADAVEEDYGDIVFGPWDTYEPVTKLYRYSFDVEAWNARAA